MRNLQSIHGSEVEACSYWKKPRVSVVFVAFQQFMSFLSSLQELTRNDSFKHCQKKCYIHLPDVSVHVIRIWRTLDWRCQSVTTSMKGVWCALARLGAELSGVEGGRGGLFWGGKRGSEGGWTILPGHCQTASQPCLSSGWAGIKVKRLSSAWRRWQSDVKTNRMVNFANYIKLLVGELGRET